jgi:hypothetical protein
MGVRIMKLDEGDKVRGVDRIKFQAQNGEAAKPGAQPGAPPAAPPEGCGCPATGPGAASGEPAAGNDGTGDGNKTG